MTTGDYGYNELNGSSSYDSAYAQVWDAYINIWEKAQNDAAYMDTDEFGTGVAAMFRAFVALRPNQQYNFLKALNYLYSDYHMPTMALYPDDNGLYSMFATYIYAYYMDELGVQPESAADSTGFDIFTDLMIALEAYANSDETTFGQCMAEVQTKYTAWSGADRDAFDRSLKFLYDRYMGYFSLYEKTTDADGKEVYRYRGADWGKYKEIGGAAGRRDCPGTAGAAVYRLSGAVHRGIDSDVPCVYLLLRAYPVAGGSAVGKRR